MPELGTSSKPSSSWHAFGAGNPNIELERLTAPRRIRVLSVGVWAGGWNGSCRAHLSVWASGGTLLGQSVQVTFANEGSGGPSGGNVALYTAALVTPADIEAGENFYVGFVRHPSDEHQVSGGTSGSGSHYEDQAGIGLWPSPSLTSPSTEARRIGAYVANYLEVAGAWVRRSSAWALADAVQIRRSSAWADADTVAVRRSSAWDDAE